MLQKWEEGFEVVLARRKNRTTDSWLKRNSAKFFYKIHNKLADFKIPENVGDFRLMDRIVIDAIKNLPERQRFMKGLFAWVGFKTATCLYNQKSYRIKNGTRQSSLGSSPRAGSRACT